VPDHFSLLLEWRRTEAATRGLAKLPHDFYAATTAYLADVRKSYEADLRENPSGRKGDLSRQTYQRASQVARDIVEGRAQKVIAAAFQASIGGSRDLPNALAEERTMYDRLLATLLDHRRRTSPYLETPPAGPAPGAPVASVPVAPAPASAAAAAPSTSSAPSSAPVPPATVAPPVVPPTAYVRVVKDGRPIEVGSETLDLRAEDVLSLPEETARLLVNAKVAEAITPANASRTVT
jgi:DNA replication initiation complex subunit (GINS family)